MLVIASDGSGESNQNSIAAGFGVVVYDTETQLKDPYNGFILRNEISLARIVNGELTFTYTTEPAPASNNRGELAGLLFAILLAKESGATEMVSVMDTKYCIGIFQKGGWLENWRANGITNKKNMDIINLIEQYMVGIKVEFFHQRAHLPKKTIQRLNGLDRIYAELNVEADTQAKTGKLNAVVLPDRLVGQRR